MFEEFIVLFQTSEVPAAMVNQPKCSKYRRKKDPNDQNKWHSPDTMSRLEKQSDR